VGLGGGVRHSWETAEMHKRFWRGDLRQRKYLEDLRVDGRIILKWMLEEWNGGMDSIDLFQDTDRWRALANAVMNL
jgi:hypothetical protein